MNREEFGLKLQEIQRQVQAKFSNEFCSVDNVGDLPRIMKVPGTMSIKGSNTAERPWRISKIAEFGLITESQQLKDAILAATQQEKQESSTQATKRKVNLTIHEILKKTNANGSERSSLWMQLSNKFPDWEADKKWDYIAKNNAWLNFDPEKARSKEPYLKKYEDKPNPIGYEKKKGLEKIEEPGEYLGLTSFRKKTSIEVSDQVGNVYDLNEVSGAVSVKTLYKIYKANFGAGQNKDVYVITNALENLNKGSNDLYLRPLRIDNKGLEFFESERWPEKNLLEVICKEHKIPLVEGSGQETRPLNVAEIIEAIKERHEERPILFCQTIGFPEEQLASITEEQWQNILLPDFLNEGWQKDAVIENIYKSDLLELNPQLIRPKNAMPYAPHELVFTNSKTGKTSTAKKTAISVESATTANLMGFSTAQEKIEGSLNNQTKTLRIDEIQEEKDEELHASLATFMEQGECEIRKGKAKVNVKGYATLCWQGNPKLTQVKDADLLYQEKEEDLFQKFSDCLGKISRNNEAFGGRIAEIVFRMDLTKAERQSGLKLEDIEKNEAVVSAILEKARNPFTQLYLNNKIVEWLNKPFNQSYITALKQIEEKARLQNIQEFINGHRELASRHVRGKALKLACVDLALSLMRKNLDEKELLELAEEYLQQIEEQNLKSFGNLVDVSTQNKAMLDYLQQEYAALPQHLKIILNALKEMEKTDGTKEVFLEELTGFFPAVEITGRSNPQIISRATNNMGRTNRILSKFGVVLTGNAIEPKISIKNAELFSKMEVKKNE